MGMKSYQRLCDLKALEGDNRPFCKVVADLRAGERVLAVAEFISSVSSGLWAIWDHFNVPDELQQAYGDQYPNRAAEQPLHEQWRGFQADEPEKATGFISGLKGKVAEIRAARMLEEKGYRDVTVAGNPTQGEWDISAVNESGEMIRFQVKTGQREYARSVAADMERSENVEFLVSSEIYDEISAAEAAHADRITDIGPDSDLEGDVAEGLSTLSDNAGLDLPDVVGDVVPGVAGIAATIRAVSDAKKTEREFKGADRKTKNKIHRRRTPGYAIEAISKPLGAAIGAGLGLVAGPPGAVAGGIAGSVAFGRVSRRLRTFVDDRLRNEDDEFYYRHKYYIDRLAFAFRRRADDLLAR